MVLRKGYSPRPDYIVCHARACDNVSSPFSLVEEHILEALNQWLGDYKLKWDDQITRQKLSNDVLKKSLKRMEKDISVLEKQLGRTHDLLEQGVYSPEQFLERSSTLSERIVAARKDYADLEDELGLSIARDESRRVIIPKVEHLLEVYRLLPTAAQKNALLKGVLEKVVYTKTANGSFRGVSADDFEIVLYPKLPKHDSMKGDENVK